MSKDKIINISILVSGGGSNLQAIIDSIEKGKIRGAKIVSVLSSKEDVFAIQRAINHNIPYKVVSPKQFDDEKSKNLAILEHLKDVDTDMVVLAGYMSKIDKIIIDEYKDKIINIHPSLLPKFGGKGYYGIRVHQGVIEAGEIESGATVHFVDEGIDTGKIIVQKKISVDKADTPQSLQAKVLKIEHEILPKAIIKVIEMISLKN